MSEGVLPMSIAYIFLNQGIGPSHSEIDRHTPLTDVDAGIKWH